MSSTVFVNGVTLSDDDWFNDVNRLHYTLLQDPTAVHFACDGRLTLTSGTPVTTADVTAAETIYFAPIGGGKLSLYDGSANWKTYTFTELSIDVPDVTGVHDVFVYDNSGTPTLEVLVWTNDTTRATALTTQNGVLVKTGATTRRYLGTFYSTTAGNGQTEDSFANRYLWNYYNRRVRPMRSALETTDTWPYSTATIRQANANTANQLNFVIGYSEDEVSANVVCSVANSNAGVEVEVLIGLDATNAQVANAINSVVTTAAADRIHNVHASWRGFPGIGKHYLSWLEYSVATLTTTWYGDAGQPTRTQSGISGVMMG